ncbi:hypothetical protein [Methanolobus psychrotolerans]|uniref:hypothetical protein n=1 Tax=Methanolobus psychrotolerans TaxID=1874706 RepID=UPI000B9186D0|nr:hypothetical protein [Methanolobus psychrotolerans]
MKGILKIALNMFIISIMLVGYAGAESTDSTQDELIEVTYNFPDYGLNTYETLKDNSRIIETYGIVPALKEDKEKVEWLDTLETCIENSEDGMYSYMKDDEGLLTGFGISYEGYLFVDFDERKKSDIDAATIEKIHSIIEESATTMKLSDVPVVFRYAEEEITVSRVSDWTNLIGGLGIYTPGLSSSTLCFAAEDSSGTKGFVMSAHAAKSGGGIGADIYQGTRKVGDVEYYNCVFSDSAWVEATNVRDDIYYVTDSYPKDVAGHRDADLGETVTMSGKASNIMSGTVTEQYVNQNTADWGVLQDQYSVNFVAAAGDSGAPMYTPYGSAVKVVGITRAITATTTRFSPVSGIMYDLDITPLK